MSMPSSFSSLLNAPIDDTSLEDMPSIWQCNTNPSGSKSSKKTVELWGDEETHQLLCIYEEKWIDINKGNMTARQWQEVAILLSTGCNHSTPRTGVQCKGKIEKMKRKFREEKAHENRTGANPSRWPFFDKCSSIFASAPKFSGIPNAIDCGENISPEVEVVPDSPPRSPTPNNAEKSHANSRGQRDLDEEVSSTPPQVSKTMHDTTAENIDSPPTEACKLAGVSGKPIKKRRRSDASNKEFVGAFTTFADGYLEMEAKKLQTMEKIEVNRVEMEVNRAEMIRTFHEKANETQEKIATMMMQTIQTIYAMKYSGSTSGGRRDDV